MPNFTLKGNITIRVLGYVNMLVATIDSLIPSRVNCPWSSLKIVTLFLQPPSIPTIKLRSKKAILQPALELMSSAWHVELGSTLCLLGHQIVAPPHIMNTCPLVDSPMVFIIPVWIIKSFYTNLTRPWRNKFVHHESHLGIAVYSSQHFSILMSVTQETGLVCQQETQSLRVSQTSGTSNFQKLFSMRIRTGQGCLHASQSGWIPRSYYAT